MKTVGFLGCGAMAQAILKGMLAAGYDAEGLAASNRSAAKLTEFADATGIRTCGNVELIERSEILVLAVKPQVMDDLLPELRSAFAAFKGLVISLAAGRTLARLGDLTGLSATPRARILRAIPNTPALVRAGMTSLTPGSGVTEEDMDDARAIFASVGEVFEIPETMIDAWSAVTSSSPAFTALYLESLADAGVHAGLPRADAYRWAAQAVAGTCALYLAQEGVPTTIKDQVCSPGGSSIVGIRHLEERAFRGTVIEAVTATVERSRAMAAETTETAETAKTE